MIDQVNLLEGLSSQRQRDLTREAEEHRLIKAVQRSAHTQLSHRILGELGIALEAWGAHLKRKYRGVSRSRPELKGELKRAE